MTSLQFNLLPDIKLEYIKTQKTRNRVVILAFLVSGAALLGFLLLALTVQIVQKKQLNDADRQIKEASANLEKINGLPQLLTVENQLKSLVSLHQGKHVSSRIFDYLTVVTPTNVKVARVFIDFSQNTMTLDGTTDDHKSVNTFVDTLKFTTFTTVDGSSERAAFPKVIESSFGLTPTAATFTLNLTFEPELFSNNIADSSGKLVTPKLKVPSLTTTRSVLNDPGNLLFKENPQ